MESSGPCSAELASEEAEKVEAVLSKAGLLHLKPRFVREKVRGSLRVTLKRLTSYTLFIF